MAAATALHSLLCTSLSNSSSAFPLPRSHLARPGKSVLSLHRTPAATVVSILRPAPPRSRDSGFGRTALLLLARARDRSLLSSALNSVLVCTSISLSVSLLVADVDLASAFVVTPQQKLQTDELTTVRLFQENTPSVVYITNLAVKNRLAIDSRAVNLQVTLKQEDPPPLSHT